MKMTPFFRLAAVAAVALAPSLQAATDIWNGAAVNSANIPWSTPGNWSLGTTPATGDDVKFFDNGALTGFSNINSTVDSTLSVNTLAFGNTNNSHTLLITNGVTLSVTGASSLQFFTAGDTGLSKVLTNTITGAGTLTVNNAAGIVAINQGNSVAAPSRATLIMSDLNTFNLTGLRVGIGSSTVFPNSGSANQRVGGQLILARTNKIILNYGDTAANYLTSGRTNAIELSRNAGNNPGIISVLQLGQTNELYLDSVSAGLDKSGNNSTAASGVILFNPSFPNPVAFIRGTNGVSSRVKWWSIGDGNTSASSSNGGRGTNDFSAGTVDMMVDVMSLGRSCNAANTSWPGPHSGVLVLNAGMVDVNTIYAGNDAFNQPTSTPGSAGTIAISGATILKVNTSLILGNTASSSGTGATKTFGAINVTNGTVLANTITVGTLSVSNVINLTNATLIVTNTLANNASGLFALAMSNSTLGLKLSPGAARLGLVQTLKSGGTTNFIQLDSTTTLFGSYPTQMVLIKYTSWAGSNNFSLANLPGWATGGTLVSNNANASLDLLLSSDPRPVISTQPAGYSGSVGDSVSLFTAHSGVGPFTYQWRRSGTNISNSGNWSGTTSSNLLINPAAVADSGDYTLVIANAYSTVTSSVATVTISSGAPIAPSITGPTPSSQSVTATSNITFTTSVSGFPAPAIQWQKGGVDISGATSANYTLNNVQYPGDAGTYSIIASNSAGVVTNSVTLTVYVFPAITTQPTNLTVVAGSSATFSVVATGVPTVGYQWRKNGTPISGANSSSYTIGSTVATDIATYSVVVTNAAGSVTSANASLIVNSPMSVTTLSPANNATGVCYDAPFYVTFSQTPVLRNVGTIKIFDAANNTPVETIDVSSIAINGTMARNAFPGDAQGFNYYPVVITGNTAAIYPRSSTVMTSNKNYFVTIDNGTFTDTSSNYFAGITVSNTWNFATKVSGPANPTNVVVNATGSADFATVQGAVDSVAANSTSNTVINIRDGTYFEIVNVSKRSIDFRGQSRSGTVIKYPNNAGIAPSGTTHARMTFKVNGNDITIENLTITNSTPQGGSQAEALMIEGNGASTAAKRCIVNNCTIASRQDTILANINSSQGYFYNSAILGNFDYIWGGGNLFFTNCEIRTISGTATPNLSASRTDAGATGNWTGFNGLSVSNGFSFVRCQLTRESGVTNCTMAGSNGTTNGNAAWSYCTIDTACYTNANATAGASQLLWQYGNSNATASAAVSFANLTTLPDSDARLLAATNVNTWLNGWTPALLPNILTQPVGGIGDSGGNFTFNVSATGIPDPTYQWQFNGTDISGATGNSLALTTLSNGNTGDYTVIVNNGSGSVTSSVATLTVTCVTANVSAPSAQTVSLGTAATFSVTSTSTLPAYQWQFSPDSGTTWLNVTNGTGGTSASFTTAATTSGDNGNQYRVLVNIACDSSSITSSVANLTVTCFNASVSTSPTDVFVASGSPASFSVTATGSLLSYQWQVSTDNGATYNNLSGATSATYNIASAAPTDNGKKYQCVVTAACGAPATSGSAKLSVLDATTTSFRSQASGAWSNTSIWQLSVDNGANWVSASITPTSANCTNATVRNGHTVSVTTAVTVDDVVVASGGILQLTNSAILTLAGTGADIYGTLQVPSTQTGNLLSGDSTSTLRFQNGGSFIWLPITAANIPRASWLTGSTCTISPAAAGAAAPAAGTLQQAFYNFKWLWPNMSGSVNLAGNLTNVSGDLTIATTNSPNAGALKLYNAEGGGTTNLNVGGSLIVQSGYLCTIGSSTANSAININIGGSLVISNGAFIDIRDSGALGACNFTLTGASAVYANANPGVVAGLTNSGGNANGRFNWTVANGATLTLNNDLPLFNASLVTVSSGGTLACTGGAVITNVVFLGGTSNNTVTVASGGALRIGATAGITATANTGSIQANIRNFDTNADYIYLGSAAQVLGDGLPTTVRNLTLANGMTNSVTVSNTVANATPSYSVSGTLTANSAVTAYTVTGSALKRGSYTLFTYGTLSGSLASTPVLTSGSVIATPSVIGGNLVVPNTAPVAVTDALHRSSGIAIKIKKSDLLANDTDADLDTLSISAVSGTTTNGATLTTDATYVFVPANTVADSFSYTANDGHGGTASGTVNIGIVAGTGQGTGSINTTGGNPNLTFYGISGNSYIIQVSTDLTAWTDVTTITADSNGVIHYTDTAPPTPAAYYRLKSN